MAEKLVTVEVLSGKDHMGPAGNIVGAGGTYQTTKPQAMALVGRALVKIVETAVPPAAEEATKVPAEPDRWPLKISPKDFLTRFPNADNANAALARRLVEAGRGDEVASPEPDPNAGTADTGLKVAPAAAPPAPAIGAAPTSTEG